MLPSVRDIFLIDFYEKLTQNTKLIGANELDPLVDYFFGKSLEGASYLPHNQRNTIHNQLPTGTYIYNKIKNKFPIVLDILILGEGKISICGVTLLHLIRDVDIYGFGLYFDSCTVLEATNLLMKFLEMLKEQVISYLISDDRIYFEYKEGTYPFFSTIIYENKGSILRNIGPAPSRHGYNPFSGYFCSISGAISRAMRVYPIDPDFKYVKLYKYMCFNILFHGFNESLEGKNRIETIDGYIKYNNGYTNYVSDHPMRIKRMVLVDRLISSSPSMTLHKDKYIKVLSISSWLKGYVPYFVGIDDDKYVAMNNIRRNFNVPNDILKLLCMYLLEAEYLDTKQRLLDLKD